MSQPIEAGQHWYDGLSEVVVRGVVNVNGLSTVEWSPVLTPHKTLCLSEVSFRSKFRPGRRVLPQGGSGTAPVFAPPTHETPPPPAEFKVGDAVRLAGGSPNDPIMTVVFISRDEGLIDVAYVPVYGSEGAIRRDSFPPAALRAVGSGAVPQET